VRIYDSIQLQVVVLPTCRSQWRRSCNNHVFTLVVSGSGQDQGHVDQMRQ